MKRFLILALLGGAPLASFAAEPVAAAQQVQSVEITVEGGYHPDRVVVKAGAPVRLTFLRKEYTSCTAEVVFPTLGIRAALPPNEPVVVDLPALPVGEVAFHCGMHMIHGTIVVEERE